MTDEQIKQNAEEYAGNSAKHLQQPYEEYKLRYDAYIAGAHSRDEEIKQLEFDKYLHTKRIKVQEEILEELRNPWISIKKHPDDVTKDYLLEYEDGSHIVAMWDSGMWMSKNLHPLKEPTRWMPIPKIEKGGEQ